MSPSVRSDTAHGGFTLIELLVAMAILAIVTVLAWRGLDQITRARGAIVAFLGQEQATTQFFDQFRYDADNVVSDADLNDPPVQLAPGELRLVRHLYQPGVAPRLQVVRYRLNGARLVRYASAPLATLSAVHTSLGANLDPPDNWSVYALDATLAAVQLRAFVPGTGWTDREDELVSAADANRVGPGISSSAVATPTTRAVTGLEVRIQSPSLRYPLTRIVTVGG